jgi:hypothetical protein
VQQRGHARRKLDVQRHGEQIRRLVAEVPDEPTYCEFKEALSYGTPKNNGELVKDVSPFANTDLEALGGHGYIISGVSDGGRVVGIANSAGDPSSAARQIVNGNLGPSASSTPPVPGLPIYPPDTIARKPTSFGPLFTRVRGRAIPELGA